jgi:dATP pyrophosphohydrolase
MNLRRDLIQCYVVRPAGPSNASHEFLQLHRRPGQLMAGTWQPVTGRIEPGETAVQAALRELLEETALTPYEFYSVEAVQTYYMSGDDALWFAVPFCAYVSPDAPVILDEEHDQYRWIPRDRAAEQFFWTADRRAVAEICLTLLDNAPAKPFLRISPHQK